jgi:hypothetical protein
MYSTALLFSFVVPLASAAAVKRQSLDITVSDLPMSIADTEVDEVVLRPKSHLVVLSRRTWLRLSRCHRRTMWWTVSR